MNHQKICIVENQNLNYFFLSIIEHFWAIFEWLQIKSSLVDWTFHIVTCLTMNFAFLLGLDKWKELKKGQSFQLLFAIEGKVDIFRLWKDWDIEISHKVKQSTYFWANAFHYSFSTWIFLQNFAVKSTSSKVPPFFHSISTDKHW